MTEVEVQEADRRIRKTLREAGGPEDIACEFHLVQHFVANSKELLPAFPFLVLREWEVVPGASQSGVGDLVFTDGDGRYAVVEVKFLNPGSGHTARESRRRGRQTVWWQAEHYGEKLFRRVPAALEVVCYAYTTDRVNEPLEVCAFRRTEPGEVVRVPGDAS